MTAAAGIAGIGDMISYEIEGTQQMTKFTVKPQYTLHIISKTTNHTTRQVSVNDPCDQKSRYVLYWVLGLLK